MPSSHGQPDARQVETIVDDFVGEWLSVVAALHKAGRTKDLSAFMADYMISTDIPVTKGITSAGANYLIEGQRLS